MKKDIIVCVFVIALVVALNIITSNYTKDSTKKIEEKLSSIRDKIEKNEETQVTANEIKQLKEDWEERNAKLAYYIEHDELEKVNLYIVGLESNYSSKEYGNALEELDKCEFILKHIEEKYSFSMRNIF